MAIIKSGLSRLGTRIISPSSQEEYVDIPFIPALELLNSSLTEDEVAAIGAALALLLESDATDSVWSSAALLEGISNRM